MKKNLKLQLIKTKKLIRRFMKIKINHLQLNNLIKRRVLLH